MYKKKYVYNFMYTNNIDVSLFASLLNLCRYRCNVSNLSHM